MTLSSERSTIGREVEREVDEFRPFYDDESQDRGGIKKEEEEEEEKEEKKIGEEQREGRGWK